MSHDRYHDSAGVPWEGREFSVNPYSDDDGSADLELTTALTGEIKLPAVIEALRGKRLLVPLLAELGDSELGPHGQLVDKSADLSIVAVSTPDGKSAIPAFSSVAQMQAWRSDARPVPVGVEKLAVAAVAEGHERVILDPATVAVGLRRPALAALAQGLPWSSPSENLELRTLVEKALSGRLEVVAFNLLDGDPTGRLTSPELAIILKLEPGLSIQQVQQMMADFGTALQTPRFLELVDSVSVKLVS
ncbi:MAG: hypothetical protein RIS08_1092 [Actinomycetota bacterium]|jgi:hypothetical protein